MWCYWLLYLGKDSLKIVIAQVKFLTSCMINIYIISYTLAFKQNLKKIAVQLIVVSIRSDYNLRLLHRQ